MGKGLSAGDTTSRPRVRLALAILLGLPAVCFAIHPLRAQDVSSAPGAVASRQADLAQYQGQYRSVVHPDQVHAVYVEAGALYEEREGLERQKLTPDPAPGLPDRFRIASPQAHVVFVRDAAAGSPACDWCSTAMARRWTRKLVSARSPPGPASPASIPASRR